MLTEIQKLKLPLGVWQESARTKLAERGITCEAVTVTYPDASTLEFTITPIARFKLSFMPGCKGVLISHATFIEPAFRNQKLSYMLQELKARIAGDLLASVLIATVRENNEPEQASIKRSGWARAFGFTNKRTGHTLDFVFTVPT